jgi:alpha-tubulin suppressor-like RCC1 family protein
MSIDEYLNKKSNNDRLWGWGKNESGQLGSSSANYVSKPQKIRFTCLHQD